jgi:hypothetical protein
MELERWCSRVGKMAKKKTADTTPADTAADTTAATPRRRRAATPKTTAEAGPKASNGNGTVTTSKFVSAPAASLTDGPTYDQIAEAAYLRYLSRGAGDGRDFDDWLAAEQDLKAR